MVLDGCGFSIFYLDEEVEREEILINIKRVVKDTHFHNQ